MVCKRRVNDTYEKRVNVKSDENYINWKKAKRTAEMEIMEVR